MTRKFQLLKRKTLATGRFVQLSELEFIDRHGKMRQWESADRVNSRGAAVIIAEVVPDGKIILVRQFRPPVWQYVLEFPAGLIDADEQEENEDIETLLIPKSELLQFIEAEAAKGTGIDGKLMHYALGLAAQTEDLCPSGNCLIWSKMPARQGIEKSR